MNNGAFIVGRDIFESGLWSDVQKFRIFLFIVGHAVFKDEGIDKGTVHIKRGQYLRSYRNLQRDLEYFENRSEKIYPLASISRKVSELVADGYLQTEETKLGTLFTVLEYDRYQDFSTYKKEPGTVLEQPRNSVGTALEQSWNNNNQENQENQLKDNSPKSKKRIYDVDSIHYQLAEYLFEEMKKNNPEARKPDFHKWANDIRLMMEIDNRKEEQVRNMITWSQSNDFWKGNILSAKKLRDKYDQMKVQANQSYKNNNAAAPKNDSVKYDIKQSEFFKVPEGYSFDD